MRAFSIVMILASSTNALMAELARGGMTIVQANPNRGGVNITFRAIYDEITNPSNVPILAQVPDGQKTVLINMFSNWLITFGGDTGPAYT